LLGSSGGQSLVLVTVGSAGHAGGRGAGCVVAGFGFGCGLGFGAVVAVAVVVTVVGAVVLTVGALVLEELLLPQPAKARALPTIRQAIPARSWLIWPR